MSETAQAPVPGFQETFWRTLQTFNVTRVVIALVLLAYLSLNTKRGFWSIEEFLYLEICGLYLAVAVGFAMLAAYFKRRFLLQVAIQISLDIGVISVLYVATGAKSGLAILYLFPLAGGAILAPLLLALFFASAVTLILLAESSYQILKLAPETFVSQAGLYGAAFFAAVFVINRLAARLISQEKLAAQRGQDLKMQQAINRLAIADMGDGILVIGRDTTVFTCNPAAERMLGMAFPDDKPRSKLTEIAHFLPIADAYQAWAGRAADPAVPETGAPVFVVIKPGEEPAHPGAARRELLSHLKLRFAAVETDDMTEDRTLIFLQDVSDIENQAQQLKLASMGRLTASIAHEVRNPLSAISHAASLLSEDAADPAQRRLLNIVADNVTRLNQMIEDILKLSRKAQSFGEPIPLGATMARILDEFRETHRVKKEMVELGDMGQYRVWFDPLHLHEVVVNLLSNAMRYASGDAASIRLHLLSDSVNRLELHVQDDGPAIAPEVRAHLFEPFYTTSSKGTGLGLYVARELCLNNGAMLDYEYRVDLQAGGEEETHGRFVITFAVPHPA